MAVNGLGSGIDKGTCQNGTALDDYADYLAAQSLSQAGQFTEAAAQLNVPVRFVERCVFQRRIRVVRLGRHVRIPESALAELMTDGTTPSRPVR